VLSWSTPKKASAALRRTGFFHARSWGLPALHPVSLLVKMNKHALLNSLVYWLDRVTLPSTPMSANGVLRAQIRHAQSAVARPGIGPLKTGASR
jgi:hypothetical protein